MHDIHDHIIEKLNGNVKTVYFEESPLMSTYLVAVVVGLFDHIEETTADGNSYNEAMFHRFITYSFHFPERGKITNVISFDWSSRD